MFVALRGSPLPPYVRPAQVVPGMIFNDWFRVLGFRVLGFRVLQVNLIESQERPLSSTHAKMYLGFPGVLGRVVPRKSQLSSEFLGSNRGFRVMI